MKQSYIVIGLLLLGACTSKENNNKTELVEPIETTTIVEVDSIDKKNNKYVVTEEVFWLLPEEQEAHFDKAKENYEKKEFKQAASEIRKALVYLDLEINKAEVPEKEALLPVKEKLEIISNKLDKGEKVTEAELKKIFHETNVDLYKTYLAQQLKAKWDYDVDKNEISLHLDQAIQKLENTEKWSDDKFDVDTKKLIAEGKSLHQKIKVSLEKDKKSIKKEWQLFLEKLKLMDAKEGSALD